MELKETEHNYYCSNANYYVGNGNGENYGLCTHENWTEFQEEWLLNDGTLDDDFNHVFRFDVREKEDDEGNATGEFYLMLYFVLQRKGIFRPVRINQITKEDMPSIKDFLSGRWDYLREQWVELL